MRFHWSQISIILIIVIFAGCFEPPEFSEVPHIKFNSLKYIEYQDAPDSMLLKFDFEDGDGDIGINSQFLDYPFHNTNIIIDSRDSVVTISNDIVPPLYAAPYVPPYYYVDLKESFSDTDNRPGYDRCNYLYDEDVSADTIYIQKNEFTNNFHIDFLERKNGVYSKVVFSSGSCDLVDFNGRIPIFDPEHDGKSLSGTISYSLYSRGFKTILTPDTFKVRFYLYDRALNKSNTVESPEFLFQDILESR